MSRSSVGSRVRIELAKARLREGWAPVIGPLADEHINRPRRVTEAITSRLKSLGQEVTRRDLILAGLAAGVGGLALGVRPSPDARKLPLGPASPLFETARDFASVEDFPEIEPTPLPTSHGEIGPPRPTKRPFEESQVVNAAPPMPAKRPKDHVPRSPLFAERRLALVNENTGESINAVYWAEGDYVLEGLEDIQVLLRDHHTDEIHAIDLKLVETLHKLGKALDSNRPLHVLSAYRSPRTNRHLAMRYDGVAENSFHMKGKAVDLYIPGRRKRDLARAALKMRVGGVGVYSSFVHVDTGPIRRWNS